MKDNLVEKISSLKDFKLSRWEDFPSFGIYRDQLLTIVTDEIKDIFPEKEDIITASMVNNYVKWEIIPRPKKKKYYREHIGICIIVSLLKPILSINEIKRGILLQLSLSDSKEAYDKFCDTLESSFKHNIDMTTEKMNFQALDVERESLGMSTACSALYFQIITKMIIENEGINEENLKYKNISEIMEEDED